MTGTTRSSLMVCEGRWSFMLAETCFMTCLNVMLFLYCCNRRLLGFCRCVEQINKTNRGEIAPEDLKERQVSYPFLRCCVLLETSWQ